MSPLAGAHASKLKWANLRSRELYDRVADCVKHASHLLIAAFVQLQLEPGIIAAGAQRAHFGRLTPLAPTTLEPAAQAINPFIARHSFRFDSIDFRNSVLGGRHQI